MNIAYRHIARITFAALALVAITACGGGNSSPSSSPPPPPPPAMYSIGGTVSGLDAGQSVVLQLNGGNDQTVSTNIAFTFTTKAISGGAYAVTVVGFPVGKTCTVTGGSGTASANVTGVAVACVTIPTFSIGGSVSGLVGRGLALRLFVKMQYGAPPGELLEISGNGAFTFHSTPAQGVSSGLEVRVESQPTLPTQRCVVRNRFLVLTTTNFAEVDVACGEFSYVTNAAADTLSAFFIDARTGAMAAVGAPVAVGMTPNTIVSTTDKKYLYVANSGSNDVSALAVDASSGALTAVPGSPFATGTSPKSVAVYTDWSTDARHTSFSLHSFLYVANAGSDNLSAYVINLRTGVPTPVSPASYLAGTGPSAMAIHPIGPFLYAANTGGSNDISAFSIDGLTGTLVPISGSPYLSGSKVSSLTFGGGGTFLYAADASGSTAAIYGFSVDPYGSATGGALSKLAGFPYPLTSCTFVVADQTGAYLYATAGTGLFGYGIDQKTGGLTPLPGFPMGVSATATSISVDPTNQFLYIANGSAGTVIGFQLNAATGALSPMPSSPFAASKSADFIATF